MKNAPSTHSPRKIHPLVLLPLAVALLAVLLFTRPLSGAVLLPDQEQIAVLYIHAPYAPEQERPIPGGFDYQLEGEELREFLSHFNATRFRRKVGGESAVTGETWHLLFDYEDGFGNAFDLTDENVCLRELRRDKGLARQSVYTVLDGELLSLLQLQYP